MMTTTITAFTKKQDRDESYCLMDDSGFLSISPEQACFRSNNVYKSQIVSCMKQRVLTDNDLLEKIKCLSHVLYDIEKEAQQ